MDLLASWGIFPDSVTGHSSGEIAAAYAVGALSMEDAISVAYYRGVAASKLQTLNTGHGKGGMMALGMPAEDVQPYLDGLESGKAVVACINSPSNVTISGDLVAIQELEQILSEKQVFSRRLAVEVAYHSHHMKAIGHEYFASIADIRPRLEADASLNKKAIPFFSSVTGKETKASDLGPQYWVSNLLNQVKFVDSVQTLCFETGNLKNAPGGTSTKRQKRAGAARKASIDLLVEIGPHSALSAPIKQILKADPKLNAAEIVYSSALTRYSNAVTSALNLVATLSTAGYNSLDFTAINRPTDDTTCRKNEVKLLVDLPPYAWNHTRPYWAESRISKVYRNRKYPRTDLLGVPDRMSCPFEPRWRNYLRVSEIPWLEDHKIQSNIVYPAAGYIVMAIEAAFQHVMKNNNNNNSDRRHVAGYHLRDISIQSALVINETSAAEVMISLRACEPSHLDLSDTVYQFHVYSISEDNRWTEHCKGFIGVEYATPNTESTILERFEETAKSISSNETPTSNFQDIDIQTFYEKLSTAGLEYGSCFANLTAARFAGGICVAEIVNPDTAAVMPMNFQHPFLIHPCTLDSVFHTIFVGLSENMGLGEEPPIPVLIDELYVSRDVNSEPGHKMDIRTSVKKGERRGDIVASILVSDRDDVEGNDKKHVVSISGLTCRRLARDVTTSKTKQVNRIAYNFEWKADPDLLSEASISKLFFPEEDIRGHHFHPQETKKIRDLYDRCAVYYIKKALGTINPADVIKLEPHLKRQWSFFVGIDKQYQDIKENFPIERVGLSGPRGELLCAIGEKLPAILKKEVNVSTIIHEAGLLDAYWEDTSYLTQGYETACRYLDMVSHKNPMVSVLEVGAGNGVASSRFLEQLSTHSENIPRCREYTITDPDSSVFENTAQKLRRWSDWISFKQLNIEGDLESQSFQLGQYDVVIVPYGIHTATSTEKVLNNIRALLKPGGHFILIDPVFKKGDLVQQMIFGNFPGWWNPPSSEDQWNDILLNAQFSGPEIFIECKDRESGNGCSVIIPRSPRETSTSNTDILIIAEKGDSGVSVKHLQKLLSEVPLNVEVTTFARANPEGRTCIVLSELQPSVLAHPDTKTFDILKQIFLQSAGVLWVSRGGATIATTNPDASLVLGFARTARSEGGVDPIVTLDLDGGNPVSGDMAAGIIFELLRYRFLLGKSSGEDTEFAERDGILCISRVVDNPRLNETIAALQDDHAVSEQVFGQLNRLIRAAVATVDDGSEMVRFVDDTTRPAELLPGYVAIEVKAIGLDEKDAQVVTGHAQPGTLLGLECSGIVHAVGDGVDGFAVGDRVACFGSGTAANIYNAHASTVQKIPDDMSFDIAATLPTAYCAGFYIVDHLARVLPDDNVLIHGAAEPYGQAIVELCRLNGARVFATVTTPIQKDFISSRFNIPEGQIFLDEEGTFARDIMRTTDNKGVDVVIVNSKNNPGTLRQSWNCIAPYGRFIQLGSQDLSRLPTTKFKKDTLFATFNLANLVKEKPRVAAKAWEGTMSLFRAKALQGPSAVSTYSISDISDALKAINAGKHSSDKVIVTVGPKDIVKVSLSTIFFFFRQR